MRCAYLRKYPNQPLRGHGAGDRLTPTTPNNNPSRGVRLCVCHLYSVEYCWYPGFGRRLIIVIVYTRAKRRVKLVLTCIQACPEKSLRKSYLKLSSFLYPGITSSFHILSERKTLYLLKSCQDSSFVLKILSVGQDCARFAVAPSR